MPQVLSRLLLLPLISAFVLIGCDSMPTRGTPDSVLQAERDFDRGDFAMAAQGFLDSAASQRSQRDRWLLRAAEAWREEGALDRAESALSDINVQRLNADELERHGLLSAEIALYRKQADKALAALDAIIETLHPRYQARQLELRARAAEAAKNPFHAATARAELNDLLEPGERSDNQQHIQTLLGTLDDDDLAFGAASLPNGHPLYPFAAHVLISRGLPLPRPYIGELVAHDGEPDVDGYHPFSRIALLLPLDGALEKAARAVQDGFFAGYYQETRQRPSVRIYATQANPDSALEAWRMALQDGAQAIVGPLGRDEVAAIFEAEQGVPVPMLALNRGGELPPPPGSMSFALTPEDEGFAAANRIVERGGSRVLVIRDSSDAGQRSAGALTQRLEQHGGEVVATALIPENSPDYGPAIRSAIAEAGASRVTAGDDRRIEENRLRVAADAIFFAGRTEQARLLVSQLRLSGIYDLPIYATSQIATGAGNPQLDRELDGIEFTEAPWLISEQLPDLPARTATAPLEHNGSSSARLFAFGLDAFRLIGYFNHVRSDPQATLHGATGDLRFDGFGQIQRHPAWAKFQGGRIQAARERGLIGDELQFDRP